MESINYKEIQKFNYDNRDKSLKCPDCSGELQPHYYGYSCLECGQLFNDKLEYFTGLD